MKKILRLCYWQSRKYFHGYGLARFGLVRRTERVIRSILRSDFAEVLGHQICLDRKDILNLSVDGVHEPLITDLIQRIVGNGDVVLDIGAHIGYYTLIFARRVGPQGRVFAFEPGAENFALLARNVRSNGYCNVTLIPKAVSAEEGTARLYLAEDNSGDNRIYDSFDGRRYEDIETIVLDRYFADDPGKIDFIKMDIQGAEYAVLYGMRGLLERNKALKLVTEFWPFGLHTFGADPAAYLSLLVEHGFKMWNINEQLGKILSTSVDELLNTYTIEKQNATDLFCSHG